MASILWLDTVGQEDQPRVGSKAGTLGSLQRAGFPVPPGFCVTLKGATHVTARLWAEVEDAYKRLAPNDGVVAVRSSGVEEDTADASFAGQYDTVLNVRGTKALRAAVECCWSSATSLRARAYKRRHRKTEDWLPVLVQQQVPASIGGVLYTVDPVSGSNREILIEAAPGLGDGVVSGRVAPAQYRVRQGGEVRPLTDHDLLAPSQCRALAEMARRIESVLGNGLDIEWAVSEERIYILQARPVTTGTKALPLGQVWTRANIGEVLPGVITPLTWDVFRATVLNCGASAVRTAGDDESDCDGIRRIRGRAYLRLDGLLDAFCYLPTVTPQVMVEVLGVEQVAAGKNYVRPSGGRVRLAQAAFWLDVVGVMPRLRLLVRRLSPPPAVRASNIDALLAWARDCFRVHRTCTAYAIGAFGVLARLLDRWLPKDARLLLPEILIGRENLQTARQGISLQEIAEEARASHRLVTLLKADLPWVEMARRLPHVPGGQAIQERLRSFFEMNGARSVGEFELAVARWREDPGFVFTVLQKLLDRAGDERPRVDRGVRQQRREEVVERIAGALPRGKRWVFRRILAAYTDYSTFRENVKYRLMEGWAVLRCAFLDMGHTLVTQGVLAQANDVFFLRASELEGVAGAAATPADMRGLVRARMAAHRAWEAIPEAEAGDESIDDAADSPETILSGIGCSPGVAQGHARVLCDVADADALEPGEILVAPHTDPGWTPLFLSCGAVITEIGGFLSHGATVAREYGIPTVVNVSGATRIIRSGDFITVDGTRGRVTLQRHG